MTTTLAARSDLAHLSIRGLAKSFGPFRALDGVDLDVSRGSVHAVLGENGAGKTSLMNVLFGIYRPDAGMIRLDGKIISFRSPNDAISCGVGMIHQHFHQAESLTGLENVVLGISRHFGGLRLAEHRAGVEALARELGFKVELDIPLWQMPAGMRQRIEILKALHRQARILILDEPTSVLTPGEVGSFLHSLKRLAASGVTILLVTHKLEEVLASADQVSVMRAGRVVADLKPNETTLAELSRMMMGSDGNTAGSHNAPKCGGEVVFRLQGVVANGAQGRNALNGLDLEIRAGEILGVAGIDGNGQRELGEVIAGLRPIGAGQITAFGTSLQGVGPKERAQKIGIGYVPEDRQRTGLVLDHSVELNLALRDFASSAFSRWGMLSRPRIAQRAERQVREFDVRLRSIRQPVRELSGGNQQKLIVAREIETRPRVLVVMQATKGLDLGAIAFVHRKLREQRAAGAAILYVSTELEHLLDIADRVAVISGGSIAATLPRSEATTEAIGLLMAGSGRRVAI